MPLVAAVLAGTACAVPGPGTGPAGPESLPSSVPTSVGAPAPIDEGRASLDDLDRWWPGAVAVHGRTATVVGRLPVADLRADVVAAEEAWRRCGGVWPEPLPPVVIFRARDENERAALATGRHPIPSSAPATTPTTGDGGAGPDATTVVVGTPPDARVRVHLGPSWGGLTDEGRRIVLTHECVHVAATTRPRPETPRWLVEGVAEHVAYRDARVPTAEVIDPLLRRVRRGDLPAAFPGDEAFEPGAAGAEEGVLLAYAQAHTAASAYAARYGEKALLDLVTGAGGDPGSTSALERTLLPVWREYLTTLAAAQE